EEEPSESGFRMVRLSVTGDPEATAIVNAVADHWNEKTGRPRIDDIEGLLRNSIGRKVTLVYGGENMLGANMIVAREGTLFEGQSGSPALMPKGARRRGYGITPARVIDVLP